MRNKVVVGTRHNVSCLVSSHAVWFLLQYGKPVFKAWDGTQIEKKHLQFCKRYLEVNNKASNIACRVELGRFPLSITITQKLLNYILHIQSKTEDSFVFQTFLMSFDLHSNGKSSFQSHLMKISEYFNLPDFNRPLALRGHLTIASFKQWVGILLMPEIDRAHKN